MAITYGHSVTELAADVRETPQPERRQCANCFSIDAKHVTETGAPNTAYSFAAALTCGDKVCSSKVKANQKEMSCWANTATATSAAACNECQDDEDCAFDEASIRCAAAAVGCYGRTSSTANSSMPGLVCRSAAGEAGDDYLPGLEDIPGAEGWIGNMAGRGASMVHRGVTKVGSSLNTARKNISGVVGWNFAKTIPKLRLGTSILGLLSEFKDRPVIRQMLNMAKKNIGLQHVFDRNLILKRASVFLPSKKTLQKILDKQGGKLTDSFVERVVTTITAATPSALPLTSLVRGEQLTVQDTNKKTTTGITIMVGPEGGLRMRNPAMAELAGMPAGTEWAITQVTDASNGRIFEMAPASD